MRSCYQFLSSRPFSSIPFTSVKSEQHQSLSSWPTSERPVTLKMFCLSEYVFILVFLNSYSVNKIWFAAEDNQGCRRHFGDSQWRLMESGQIKVLGTTDISCWQKHRSWFKANFSSKTARASVCIGNYQFCPHWQTGVQYRIVCMRRRRRVRRWNPNFCGRAPTRA